MKDPSPNDINAFRVPPQDLEAEQAVLGAMMLSEKAAFEVLSVIKEGDFYREAHRKLFRAIMTLEARKEPIDMITLPNELKRMGEFDGIGGISALTTLLERVPTAANAGYYAKIIKEKAEARKLIQDCTAAIGEAYEDSKDALGIKTKLVDELLREESNKYILEPMAFAGLVYEQHFQKKNIDYIPTGFDEYDSKIKGIRVGALGTITGPFENGKSTFLQNVAVGVAKTFIKWRKRKENPVDYKVLHLAFEDMAQNIMKRQICLMNDWPMENLQSRDEKILDSGRKATAYGAWADLGIRMGDKRSLGKDWKTIKLFMMKEIKNQNVKVIFIEGAERIFTQPIYGESKYDAQERMVDELDDIAQEYKVGIWAIVGQAKASKEKGAPKNEMEGGTNAWPKISRQRNFVERHKDYERDKAYENISIVKVTKNSDGLKGSFWFEGNRHTYKWKELSRAEDEKEKNND